MCDRPLLFACRKWKPGQPDNWGHGNEVGEDCAGLIHEGLWNDFFCEDLISYICEKEMEICTSISVVSNAKCFLCAPHVSGEWFPQRCPDVFLCLFLQQDRLNRSDVLKGSLQWAARLPPCGTGRLTQHMESPYGESKGTILKMSPGLQQQTSFQHWRDAFLLQSEPSPSLPASAIQQGNQRRRTFIF